MATPPLTTFPASFFLLIDPQWWLDAELLL